jgi:hypothetical protein
MERVACRAKCRRGIGLLAGVLALFAFCGVAVADPAILTVTPSPTVNPGNVLKFKAVIIFHDPAFPQKPASGTPMKIAVIGDKPDGWVTETQTITYFPLGSVNVNFTKGFTVPSNAKHGDVLNFWLEWQYKQEGTSVICYHLAKASVKVDVTKKIQQKIYLKEIQKAK